MSPKLGVMIAMEWVSRIFTPGSLTESIIGTLPQPSLHAAEGQEGDATAEQVPREQRARLASGVVAEDDRVADQRSLTIILVMTETMSLARAKARFSELVDRVERQQDRVIVTRNGKPAAVVISMDDLESLEETLAVMSDPDLAAQIRASELALVAGEAGVGLDELRADLQGRRSAEQ